jgi:hypothetical protein
MQKLNKLGAFFKVVKKKFFLIFVIMGGEKG